MRRSTAFVLCASVVALVVGGVTAATISSQAVILSGVALATVVQWRLMARAVNGPVPFAGLLVAGLNLVGATGWIWYSSIAAQAAVSFALPDTPVVYSSAAAVFVTASVSLTVGCLATGVVGRGEHSARQQLLASLSTTAGRISRVSPGRLAAAAALPAVGLLAIYGPAGLIERQQYAMVAIPGAQRLTSLLTPAGIALSALLATGVNVRTRRQGRWIVAAYGTVVFATGSRVIALLPLMLFLGWLLQGRTRTFRQSLMRVAVLIPITLAAIQLPLTLRHYAEGAGWAPYGRLLLSHPALIADIDLPSTAGNVLFAVPLTGVTANLHPFDLSWLFASVDPRPSHFTSWSSILENLRLDGHTPTNGLGELSNYGTPWLIGYMVALGAIITACQLWNRQLPNIWAASALVAGLGMAAAMTINLLQYNLRSGTRFAWYFVAWSFVLHLLPRRAYAADPGLGVPDGQGISNTALDRDRYPLPSNS